MSNTERFTGRAESYDRYRQRYPAGEILKLLQTWCGLQPGWPIADIGAGTGMLSEVFLANGNPVIAIEPNEEMRVSGERLIKSWSRFEIRNGTAEDTELPDASVAMVTAGRAFHWFDVPRALTEFRRILKPHGWMVLVSLGRAKNEGARSIDFEHLLTTRGIGYNYIREGYRVHENLQAIFAADMHQTQIAGEQKLTWDAFLGQTMSLSVVPQVSDPRFSAFEDRLRDYFNTYAVDGVLTLPTTCWINAGRLSTQ